MGYSSIEAKRNTIGMESEETDRIVAAGQADIYSMLCNLLKQQSALDVDLDAFYINPLEYQNFMILFHKLVQK